MAMNPTNMATEIIAAMGTLTDEQKRTQLDVMTKMCEAIVTHISTNAVVSVTSVSGVTVGGGVSGAGSGTIS